MTSQKFGGDWTAKKLNFFTSYLDAYLIALQNQKFKKIYIDAFAGTGEIETSDGEAYLAGSAKRALSAERRFDHYYFIESDESKASELEHMIDTEFPHLKRFTTVYRGDANEKLSKIINDIDWRFSRGLLFLDPYATQVDWATLERVAGTKSIDVWYLFPFSALNRMLPKNGKYGSWENTIDRLLGDNSWRTEFYKKDPQVSLFDLGLVDGDEDEEQTRKGCKPRTHKRIPYLPPEDDFPCVSNNPRYLRTVRTHRCFCSALQSPTKV